MTDEEFENEKLRLQLLQMQQEKQKSEERRQEETTRFGLMALWFLPFLGMILSDSTSRLAAIWLVGGFVVFLIRSLAKRR